MDNVSKEKRKDLLFVSSLHGTPCLETVKAQKISAGALLFSPRGICRPAGVLPWFGLGGPSAALRVPERQ